MVGLFNQFGKGVGIIPTTWFDLLDVCINGPKEKLDSTILSQPAIYVTSLAAIEVLRASEGGQQIFDSVDITCGLSLGEYIALAFAEAFKYIHNWIRCFVQIVLLNHFEDGLKLVKLRGAAMQELCDAANEEVDEANKVQIANFLCTKYLPWKN